MGYIRVCDLCGKPLCGNEHEYKIKRSWYSFPDYGWEKIECHDSCVKKLLTAVADDFGEWTDVGSLSCRCSKCGCKNNRPTSYCPACGKKMRLYDRFIDASQ